MGDQWFLDEVFIKINGKQHYLWRAVDQDNNELDILVTKKRDKKSALKFFRKLFKNHGTTANRIVTDQLKSYPAALREMSCKIPHDTARYHNNIAEISHQKTRQQQRQICGSASRQFKSVHQTQRSLSCHGVINNHFRQQRHLLKAKHYRFFRDRAIDEWAEITCAQNMGIAA